MKRDAISLSDVPPEQQDTHEALVEWARWCEARPVPAVCPMFRLVRIKATTDDSGGGSVDVAQALAAERTMRHLSDRHRTALQWFYLYAYIPDHKVAKAMHTNRAGLAALVLEARAMVKNRMRRAIDERQPFAG